MSAITSSALICNQCGKTYESNSYSQDFLNSLIDCECGGRFVHYSIEDRYNLEGRFWCFGCGMYLPGMHPDHEEGK